MFSVAGVLATLVKVVFIIKCNVFSCPKRFPIWMLSCVFAWPFSEPVVSHMGLGGFVFSFLVMDLMRHQAFW